MDMGFDDKIAARALRRANNDFNKALDMLQSNTVPEEVRRHARALAIGPHPRQRRFLHAHARLAGQL